MGEPLTITYIFRFTEDDVVVSKVRLDPATLECVAEPRESYPNWVALAYHQCKNCPFSPEEVPNCPLAEKLIEFVETFGERISYEEVDLEVLTELRNYAGRTTLQDSLRSLMGIFMASSGCPHLEPLRPMLLTHLPLASGRETAFKAVTMYLMAQYLIQREGGSPDWDLDRLPDLYEEIHEVNVGFSQRLSAVSPSDANVNSIIKLDLYTFIVPQATEKHLEEFAPYFKPYLK